MIGRNPYVIGVPLTEAAAFYGRQDFFQFIRDVLDAEQQNVIVLYGQRRIGKTSVLHRAAQWLRDQGGWFPVYFDLQGKERLSLGEVLANLAQTIARRLSLDKPDATLFDEGGRYFSDRFLPLAFSHLEGRRLVLLFDEFDVLSDELASPRSASETLFPYLQDLIATQRTIGFIFVVGRRIEELATHFQAIFKQAVYRRVGHLKPDDSKALIVEPAQALISYDDDALREIQRLAAGHPYFTQLICFEAFNAVKASGRDTVSREVINEAVNRAIESGHGALNWFWEGLPRAERFILSAVAQASSESGVSSNDDVRRLLEENRILLSGLELKDAPDRLVEWEMLRRNGTDGYAFVVELVRRWIVNEHPLSNARRDIDYVNKRAVRLFENAREAHSAGDLPYARDEYRRTLKANPNHSGAQLGLALVLYELGELDEAIVEFERAYAIDEMSARDGLVRARLAHADALEKQGLVDQALLEYEQVLRLASAEETAVRRLGWIWMARADAALARGDLGVVRDAARESLQRDHGGELAARLQSGLVAHAEQSTTRGDVAHGSDIYSLLLELLPQRTELLPQAAAFWAKTGDLLESQGKLDATVESYLKAAAACPDDAAIAGRLASVQRKLEEQQTVGRVFDEALAAHRAGNMDRARDGWKKLIQFDVLSYQGHNIATLLAETIVGPPAPPVNGAPAVGSGIGPRVDAVSDVPRKVGKSQRRKVADADDEAVAAETFDAMRAGIGLLPGAGVEPLAATTSRDWHETFDGNADAASVEENTDPLTQGASERIDDAGPRVYDPFPASNILRWLLMAAAVVGAILLAATWPASITGVQLSDNKPMLKGNVFQLYPHLLYSSDSRRRPEEPYSWSAYTWTSSNSAVVEVDSSGGARAVGPGTAQITARYGDVEGSTTIIVESVEGLSLPTHGPVKVGEVFELRPTATSTGGGQAALGLGPSSYGWTSGDQSVATVIFGTVTAKSPGTTRITAYFGNVQNSTQITVRQWDVPRMKANVVELKFFAGATFLDPSDRKYASDLSPGPKDWVWAEVTLHFDKTAKDRQLTATLAIEVFGPDNSKWETGPFDITAKPDWEGIVAPRWLGSPSPPAGRYRIEVKHLAKVIATGNFVVK